MTMHVSISALAVVCWILGIINGVTAQNATGRDDAKRRVKGTGAEEVVKLAVPGGNLFGTLLVPPARKKVPVVLIIAGSGPTDRNGNSPLFKAPNNSLKMLAEGIASNGIASLRYDKRGIGESGREMMLAAKASGKIPREEDLRFDAYIDDAALWVRELRRDKRFSTVSIVGHSEGSLIGMIAARKANADAFISIAGAGRPAGQILLEQLRPQLPSELFKTAEDIVGQLVAGKTVDSVPQSLQILFRPSVQPYMISWLRLDPAKEVARLNVPVLVAQGTTDLQTTTRDSELLAAAKPSIRLMPIDGMNHVLKAVPADPAQQAASYSDPALPVVPKLINEISRFVSGLKD